MCYDAIGSSACIRILQSLLHTGNPADSFHRIRFGGRVAELFSAFNDVGCCLWCGHGLYARHQRDRCINLGCICLFSRYSVGA